MDLVRSHPDCQTPGAVKTHPKSVDQPSFRSPAASPPFRQPIRNRFHQTLRWAWVTLLLATSACTSIRETEPSPKPLSLSPAVDIHTHARPNQVRVTHLDLDLRLDFKLKQADGSVQLDLQRVDPNAPLILDSNDLEILRVTAGDGSTRPFNLGPKDPKLGSALSISLAPRDRRITVHYRTSPNAEAMQWLAPEQTAGGQHPFLFTQGQSILTRSWIPLQDSPGIRVTYAAQIQAPEGLTPLMSAEQLGRDNNGPFRFRMREPIPPYLIALACGQLHFLPISERCGVWAEAPTVRQARDELSDTEQMIRSAERLFGRYRWGRYDILILPPSFPFGGMENPRLTFATPTILAGDRSLVGLVAHELAHSWSGNLVTNARWTDFWLNEGFTVYLEQRIMEEVYGVERSEMEKQLGRRDLEEELKSLESWQQILETPLEGRHPDEGFSQVPYEKGALFLRRLETLVGRREFDLFLNRYFKRHAFQSITTEDFLADLKSDLFERIPSTDSNVNLEDWIRKPGLPADAEVVRSRWLAAVDVELGRWQSGAPPKSLKTQGWVTQQWMHFLQGLPRLLKPSQMRDLDAAFQFTSSGNAEILSQWFLVTIRNQYREADQRLERFLMTVGRRKYIKPLYAELATTPEGLARAKAIYTQARPRYHAVATTTIDALLKEK